MGMAVRSETLVRLLGLSDPKTLAHTQSVLPPPPACREAGVPRRGEKRLCWSLCWAHPTHRGVSTSGWHSDNSEGEAGRAGALFPHLDNEESHFDR